MDKILLLYARLCSAYAHEGTHDHASEVRHMAAIRAVWIAIIILVMAVAPLVTQQFSGSSDDTTAYAAFAGGARSGERAYAPSQKNNNNDNNQPNADHSNNNNSNNGDDDNDNGGGNDNGGNNNNGNNNNGNNNNGNNNNGNDNVVHRPNESVNRPTKCFDAREVGVVQLGTGSYDVTVSVMPHSSFNQTTRLTLKKLDPASQPAVTGGTLIDSVVFSLDAQSSCDGAAIGTLPNIVNLGIVYNVTNAVDKSKLQIVRWSGSAWTNVDTVPDPVPGNPYVSASVNMAGVYALIQKP